MMRILTLTTDEAVLAELGHRLARHRLERNWTQAELAAEAGLGQATVQRAERGESIQMTSMVRLLRSLDLLGGLDTAVPEAIDLPISQLERERRRGRGRVRASRRTARRDRQDDSGERRDDSAGQPWRWGAEPQTGGAESRNSGEPGGAR